MKTSNLFIVFILLFPTAKISAQDYTSSDVEISDLKGATLNLGCLLNENSKAPKLFLFWDTNDPHAYDEISDFLQSFNDSTQNISTKVISIILNDNVNSTTAFKSGHEMAMEIFMDKNGSVKRKFGIWKGSLAIAFNGDGKQLWKFLIPCSPLRH